MCFLSLYFFFFKKVKLIETHLEEEEENIHTFSEDKKSF